MEQNEIIQEVITKIENMKDGERTSIGAIIGKRMSTEDYVIIFEKVYTALFEKGIVLDFSEYEGEKVGLPALTPFVKRTKI